MLLFYRIKSIVDGYWKFESSLLKEYSPVRALVLLFSLPESRSCQDSCINHQSPVY